MKASLVAILVILMSTLISSATEREYENYIHSKLKMGFCYNASQPDSKIFWYYKGLSTALNEFIENKIRNLELKDKVFEIQFGCRLFGGHPSIEISQSSSKYYVFIHGLTDLKYLTRIIEYFAHPDYKSFVIEAKDLNELMRKNENALKVFNDRLDKCVPNIDMSFFKDRVVRVFELDKLRVDYSADKLKMYINSRFIGSNFKMPCPVKLTDNYIVNISDTIKVFNALGEEINQLSTNKNAGELNSYFKMHAYSKWMNFYYLNEPIISYSSNENRFYRLKR